MHVHEIPDDDLELFREAAGKTGGLQRQLGEEHERHLVVTHTIMARLLEARKEMQGLETVLLKKYVANKPGQYQLVPELGGFIEVVQAQEMRNNENERHTDSSQKPQDDPT